MKFYKFIHDEGSRRKFSEAVGDYPTQEITCSVCGRTYSSFISDNSIPYKVYLTNENYADFVWEYYQLISESAKVLLQAEEINGYVLDQIIMRGRNDLTKDEIKELKESRYKVENVPVSPPPYYRIIIKHKASLHEKSNIYLKEYCDVCGYKKYDSDVGFLERKCFIDSCSLNGDDIFGLEGVGGIYCNERFIDVYKKNKLTGLMFEEVVVI